MKMKNLFFTILWMCICVQVNAQYTRARVLENDYLPPASAYVADDTCFTRVDPASSEECSAKSTTWIAPKASDNWFISIGGGIGDLLNEEYGYISFSQRVNPSFSFAFGKWISPTWGLRVNVTGAKLQGFATNGWSAYPQYDPVNGWSRESDPEGNRPPPPFIGQGLWYIGKNYPYKPGEGEPLPPGNPTNTYLPLYQSQMFAEIKSRYFDQAGVVKGSSNGKSEWGYIYHVPYMAATVDLMLNINNFFTPYRPNRVFETYIYGGLGWSHTFGIDKDRTHQTDINTVMGKGGIAMNFRLSNSASVYLDVQGLIIPEVFSWKVGDGNTMDLVMNYTVGMTFDINRRFTRAPEYRPNVGNYVPKAIAPMPQPQPTNEKFYVVIHYQIDKHNVQASEMHKLDEIARFMRNNPTKRLAVSGYADVETANPSYNQKLSEKRTLEVVRLLRDRYGIETYRLNTKSFGDRVQPFPQNELNRAVVVFDME